MRFATIDGRPRAPIMRGMLGPYTSTSTIPTEAPSAWSPSARLTATVDFPTPPFPEDTAMVCFTSGISSSGAAFRGSVGVPVAGALGRRGARGDPGLDVGHPGKRLHDLPRPAVDLGAREGGCSPVNWRVKATCPSSTVSPSTRPSATMSRPRLGSTTPRSAARTASLVSAALLPPK